MSTASSSNLRGTNTLADTWPRMTWLLALILMLWAGSVNADWRRDYSRAKDAWENKQYSEARTLMQGVIAENPMPSKSERLTGRRLEAYVPQLYLGLSLVELGDCDGAVAQLSKPGLTSVTQSLGAEEGLRTRALDRCQKSIAASKSTLPAVTPPPAADLPAVATPVPPPRPPIRGSPNAPGLNS